MINLVLAVGALEGESLEKWTTCVRRIEEIGLEGADAETVIGQAFGWGKQSYWLNKKKDQLPDMKQVLLLRDLNRLHVPPARRISSDILNKCVCVD